MYKLNKHTFFQKLQKLKNWLRNLKKKKDFKIIKKEENFKINIKILTKNLALISQTIADLFKIITQKKIE